MVQKKSPHTWVVFHPHKKPSTTTSFRLFGISGAEHFLVPKKRVVRSSLTSHKGPCLPPRVRFFGGFLVLKFVGKNKPTNRCSTKEWPKKSQENKLRVYQFFLRVFFGGAKSKKNTLAAKVLCTKVLPSLKLTQHLKMDGWNTIVSFWECLFSGAFAVSFRDFYGKVNFSTTRNCHRTAGTEDGQLLCLVGEAFAGW